VSGGNPRRPRVAQAIRETLGGLIEREMRDPRIRQAGFVSVNHVDLNKDMSVANVYVGFYGGDDSLVETAVEALVKGAGRLRGPLGRALRLQRTPELRFMLDQSGEMGVRLSEVLRDDRQKRADAGVDEDDE
jgi:ribosome-binding factor A